MLGVLGVRLHAGKELCIREPGRARLCFIVLHIVHLAIPEKEMRGSADAMSRSPRMRETMERTA